jgi:hypothetical protein
VRLENGELTYSEIPPKRNEAAVLVMDEMSFELTNITNDSVRIRQDNIATFTASTKLMGESTLQVQIQLDLNHPEDFYTYEGTLETMDFAAFNPLFEQMMAVRIADGRINRVEFAVNATEHVAEGQMRFYYNDLEIRLIDPDDPENPGFLRRAGSWLINRLAIKSDNPTPRGNFREGDIEVERDYQKSVFNHMSSAMMDGITSSLMPGIVERIVDSFVGDL